MREAVQSPKLFARALGGGVVAQPESLEHHRLSRGFFDRGTGGRRAAATQGLDDPITTSDKIACLGNTAVAMILIGPAATTVAN